jgi:hypothetical protein
LAGVPGADLDLPDLVTLRVLLLDRHNVPETVAIGGS